MHPSKQTSPQSSCCSPTQPSKPNLSRSDVACAVQCDLSASAVPIPGGKTYLGTRTELIPGDGESPLRMKRVKPFRMSPTTVTNAQFKTFVDETGYVTDAERWGWSFVFWRDVPAAQKNARPVPGTEWWRCVDGANWRAINGPETPGGLFLPDHPVVHVSWNDATSFAKWAGGRLPTEAEWEHAARGGLGDVRFPWGDSEPDDTSTFPCNIWQGVFPSENTAADGWKTTAPVTSFEPNGYGLYNMVGNVWEWSADAHRVRSLKKAARERRDIPPNSKVLKGGSFLCHRSYCYRYRIAARIGNTPDSTTTHQGFRVVWNA